MEGAVGLVGGRGTKEDFQALVLNLPVARKVGDKGFPTFKLLDNRSVLTKDYRTVTLKLQIESGMTQPSMSSCADTGGTGACAAACRTSSWIIRALASGAADSEAVLIASSRQSRTSPSSLSARRPGRYSERSEAFVPSQRISPSRVSARRRLNARCLQ